MNCVEVIVTARVYKESIKIDFNSYIYFLDKMRNADSGYLKSFTMYDGLSNLNNNKNNSVLEFIFEIKDERIYRYLMDLVNEEIPNIDIKISVRRKDKSC